MGFKPVQEQFNSKCRFSNTFGSSSVQKVGFQARSGTVQFKMWVLKPVRKQFSPKGGFSNPFRRSSVQNVGFQTSSAAVRSKKYVFKPVPGVFQSKHHRHKTLHLPYLHFACLGTGQTSLRSACRAADQLCATQLRPSALALEVELPRPAGDQQFPG